MRTNRALQPLTYDVRSPDEAQSDALRLLDESRAVVNQALTMLWPYLDEFGSERTGCKMSWNNAAISFSVPIAFLRPTKNSSRSRF